MTKGKKLDGKRAEQCEAAEYWAMSQVGIRGADVYDHFIASHLRRVQAKAPHYLDIGPAEMAPPDGARAQPYFGAVLTRAGAAAVRRHQPEIDAYLSVLDPNLYRTSEQRAAS